MFRNRRMFQNRPSPQLAARAKAARRSVVSVLIFRANGREQSGSGFVIKRFEWGSIVLTSDHTLGRRPIVDADFPCVRTRTHGGDVEELRFNVGHRNSDMDVAFLEVVGLTSVPPLRFTEETRVAGDEIVAVGFCDPDDLCEGGCYTTIPACSPGHLRPEGTVYKRTSADGLELYHLYLNCVGMKGMSGGPVVSMRGVTGMVDSGHHYKRRFTYAVATSSIRDVMKQYLHLHNDDTRTLTELISLL